MYAGFWKRLAALGIDTVILMLLSFITGILTALAFVLSNATGGEEIFSQVVGTIVGWLYFAYFESSRLQATPGKMFLKIKVTDMHGEQISFWRATGRHAGKIVSSIPLFAGYIMAAFTGKKQALHDLMASCLIVNKYPREPDEKSDNPDDAGQDENQYDEIQA